MMHSKPILDRKRREEHLVTPNATQRPLERTSTAFAVVMAAVCIAWAVVALIHPTPTTTSPHGWSFISPNWSLLRSSLWGPWRC